MKLSKETINVLKNFSAIQPNLVVKPGSTISTLADAKTIAAEANVAETFDREFGIYNLNEFIGALSLISEPELEFSDSFVTIKGPDGAKVKYHFADTEILTKKEKDINMPPADLSVSLSESDINNIRRAASTLGQSVLSIVIEGDECVARVIDPNNSSANTYSLTIARGMSDKYDKDFSSQIDFQFLISNLKLLPGGYHVSISTQLISKWEGATANYYIALEKTSKPQV